MVISATEFWSVLLFVNEKSEHPHKPPNLFIHFHFPLTTHLPWPSHMQLFGLKVATSTNMPSFKELLCFQESLQVVFVVLLVIVTHCCSFSHLSPKFGNGWRRAQTKSKCLGLRFLLLLFTASRLFRSLCLQTSVPPPAKQ